MNIIKEEKAGQEKVIWIKDNGEFVEYKFKHSENYYELVKYFKNKKNKNKKNKALEKKAFDTLKYIKTQVKGRSKNQNKTKINKNAKKQNENNVGKHISVSNINSHYNGGFPGFFDLSKISNKFINSYVFENANKISEDLTTIQDFLSTNKQKLGIEGFSRITVTSGYREKERQDKLHDKSENAVKHSSHIWGGGADIKFEGVSDDKRFRIFIIILKLMEHDKISKGFINVYDNSTHIHIDNLQQIKIPVKYFYKKSGLDNLTPDGFKKISKFKTKTVNTGRSNVFELRNTPSKVIGKAYKKSKNKVSDCKQLENKLDTILGETASNVNTNKKQNKIVKTSNSQMFASIKPDFNQSRDIEFS